MKIDTRKINELRDKYNSNPRANILIKGQVLLDLFSVIEGQDFEIEQLYDDRRTDATEYARAMARKQAEIEQLQIQVEQSSCVCLTCRREDESI